MGILGAGSFVSRNVSPTRAEEYYKLRKFRRAQIEVADCIGKGAYGTVWQVAQRDRGLVSLKLLVYEALSYWCDGIGKCAYGTVWQVAYTG